MKVPEDRFLDKVGSLFKNLGFEAYWPNNPIPISELKTALTKPDEIEIDIVAKLGRIGFLIESTTQQKKNKEKIIKLLQKVEVIKNSELSEIELAKLFSGIPNDAKNNFSDIEEWRAIYVGTASELIYKQIRPEDFAAGEKLKIINFDDFTYILKLTEAIGECARFELLSFLGIEFLLEKDYDAIHRYPFHLVAKREITEIEGRSLRADIFLFSCSPEFLLRTCKVWRFYGLRHHDVKTYYQRMLSNSKLKGIRKNFIQNKKIRSFPTPITVVLPSEAKPINGKLAIPFKYGSLTIIDGQHRLYSYAKLSPDIQEKAKILVNGIKFYSNSDREIGRFSARTFMDSARAHPQSINTFWF
jgi:hypothetical protein